MRKIFVVLLVSGLCGAAWAKPKVAVLGLEAIASGKPDAATVSTAHDVTVALRNRAKAGIGPWAIAPGSEKELHDEKVAGKCENEALPCMAAIGKNLGTDLVVYGKLEKTTAGYQLSVKVLDVGKKLVASAYTDTLPTAAKPTEVNTLAKKAYEKLADGTTASPASPAQPTCDFDALVKTADQAMSSGNHAAALAKYELALKCKSDEQVLRKAFLAACNSKNATKAKLYYPKLAPSQQTMMSQACLRYGIDPTK